MFRKAAAALAVGVTIVALAGCASGDSGGGSDASAEGGLITIIVNDPANPYWAAEGDAAAAEAEKLGYTSKIGAHNGDSKKESDLVDTAINEEGLAQSQLVSNNAQGAALGAQEWVNRVGTTGEYVELLGRQADNNAATRSNGYASILSQYPDLKLVGSEVANWDQKEGHDKMQSLLAANPNIIGVIAGNDQMALGAIAALKEAGKLDQVKVGGFDGAPDAAKAITDGTLQYTVLQPVVVYATAAVQQADSFLRTGKTGVSEEKQSFDCVLITPENVASYGNFSVDG
jgi:erythritol transport system substrate-binding protein